MPVPKRPPAFPFYPDAWFGSVPVETMPPDVEGTYIRLLARQWLAVSLPADPALLRRLTKLDEKEWKAAWPLLEPHFPLTEDGTARQNPTLHALHIEREEFLKESSEKGKRGAEKRWGKDAPATAEPLRRPSKRDSRGNAPVMPEPLPQPSRKHGHPIAQAMPDPMPNDDSGSGSVSGTERTTTAVAVVVPPNGTATTATAASEAVLAQFENPLHREAAAGYIRAAQHPTAVIAHLDGMISGLSAPGMQPVSPERLGEALHDMRVAGIARVTSSALAAFVEGVGRTPPDRPPSADGGVGRTSPSRPPVTGGVLSDAEIEADVMRRIEAGEFAHG